MKLEAQRAAAARRLGWTGVDPEKGEPPGSKLSGFPVPFFDREETHRLLEVMDDEEWLEFLLHLADIRGCRMDAGKWTTCRALLEAGPSEKLEAFVKAIGEWNE